MKDMFEGLSPQDALDARMDMLEFGQCFIKEENGIKRRVPPSEVYAEPTHEVTK